VWQRIAECDGGLAVEGRLILEVQQAREALALLKAGAVDALSIGFSVPAGGAAFDRTKAVRRLSRIDLWEVSIVTFPANPKARVTSAKSLSASEARDLEALLGERGLSCKNRVIAVSAFKQWLQREAGAPIITPRDEVVPDEEKELGEAVDRLLAAMRS